MSLIKYSSDMKRIKLKIIIPAFLGLAVLLYACSKTYLTVPAQGGLSQQTLASAAGVQGLLLGAYSMLDGQGAIGTSGTPGLTDASGGIWEVAADNWVYGSVTGGDDHKGSWSGDQPDIAPIENYSQNATNGFFNDKWIALYDAVNRCNLTLQTMALVKPGVMTPADTVEVRAEAVFLRGLYYFELKKMYNNVPWIDESISYSAGNYLVPNTTDIWPNIEADLNYAVTNLPELQSSVGRANVWAAKAFLAKAYMFEHKFTAAQPLLVDIIANGKNPLGVKFALLPNYGDNFNAAFKNSSESVFAAQMSVDPNSGGANGNAGDVLNFPYGGPSTCCGFYQASFSLVNSFKVDVNGLPMLDGSYNNDDLISDQGLPGAPASGPDWFKIDVRAVDPRLDWSAGRRGIPYLDWGLNPGAPWIREQSTAGPYIPIKYVVTQAQAGVLSTKYGGWATNQATADNYVYIRYAQILLWNAECAAQANDFVTATTYVNMVRTRAANTASWVKNASGPFAPYAANYKIGNYPTFLDQATALNAVYFESKLELSSEGHRFFDLVRWGIATTELTAYIQHEAKFNHISPNVLYPANNNPGAPILNSNALPANYDAALAIAVFKNNYYPIPQQQIDASVRGGVSSLTQNAGY
jgi:starch-binding outer membrane protein, SusD/RagB family